MADGQGPHEGDELEMDGDFASADTTSLPAPTRPHDPREMRAYRSTVPPSPPPQGKDSFLKSLDRLLASTPQGIKILIGIIISCVFLSAVGTVTHPSSQGLQTTNIHLHCGAPQPRQAVRNLSTPRRLAARKLPSMTPWVRR